MLAQRRLPKLTILFFSLPVVVLSTIWASIVYTLYAYLEWTFLRMPFLPISLVGTAVAFYVGFKNNSSYDRFWEGRKIWGGVVNTSRTWGVSVLGFVAPGVDDAEAQEARRELVYRHLAWINALRLQLRRSSRFFDRPARSTRARLERHAEIMRNDWDAELGPFLSAGELAHVSARANPATHLLHAQSQRVAALMAEGRLDLFHQIELMGMIEEMFALQGKCERIKNTPFPRQYAEFSRLFTRVFVALVPFGLLDVFNPLIEHSTTAGTFAPIAAMILSSAMISWVYFSMEAIGDSSEDPFERSMNDVPMNALCRTIEIDLRELLGESALPAKEQPVDMILY